MTAESEVTRVLSNPDHVILSDALKGRLGEDIENTPNSNTIWAKLESSSFSEEGSLVSLDIDSIRSIVVVSIPHFKVLNAAFSLKQSEIHIEFENYEHKIDGTVTTVQVEKNLEENNGNFNLTLCVELK